jgi:ribose 5-phosphate isomerase B
MQIVLGSDHAGFELKQELTALVQSLGHAVSDVGAHRLEPSDDYPDFADALGQAVVQKRAERGIMICGSGVGASVACNKIPGIRAGTCHDTYSAHQGVEHDDMNVIVLGARIVGSALAAEIVRAFLAARFSGEERHVRRLKKVQAIEQRYLKAGS